ncbi:MAG: aminoacetone oxidase family FAD-binding enzyme, partial [bacterium]|nr:aminoacetone oxidase family FAD-binding enzyme [bacterium]
SKMQSGKVLLATGGKSYPKTGSSGTGFTLASRFGHTITPLSPSLVPLVTKSDTAQKLQGLSLRNVRVGIWSSGKKIDEGFGEMLFTHFGVSGPMILSLSRIAVDYLDRKQPLALSIDLKPALDHRKLDRRLLREIQEHSKQHTKALLERLLPKSMIAVFLEKLHIPQEKTLSEISAEERKRLRLLLKEFRLEVIGYRSFDEAIVTSGGVSVKEIDPKTMESKLVKGLFFAGEIIDVDADTGGFNLQAAFSTGRLAGRSIM